MSKMTLVDQTVDPATPAAGRTVLFSKNGVFFVINDLGVVKPIAALPHSDALTVLNNVADITKEVRFDLAGLSTGVLRVVSLPDKDILLDDAGDPRDPNAHNHDGADITSGSIPDARIPSSAVTQHEGDVDHDALTNFAIGEHRIINDGGTSTIELLSASKISDLVSALQAGASPKESVRLATIGNNGLTGLAAIDGKTPVAGDRIGVVEQTDKIENGVYIAAAGAWTRAADFDGTPSGEVRDGVYFKVSEGDTRQHHQFMVIGSGTAVNVGTDTITFDESINVEFGTTAGTATEGNDPRILSQDENDAAQGTDGTPSNGNRFLTDSDARVLTQDENDAAQGTDGAPAAGNRYVTNSDARNTDERTPLDNSATNAKLADMAQDTIKGRITAGAGDPEDLTAAQARTILNVEDNAAADQSAAEVPFTPNGDIAATDAQAAIVEVRDDTDTKLAGKSDTGHTHPTTDIVSGVMADARIQESNVTQHEAAIDHDALTNFRIEEHREIDDSGFATTDLWSADKIDSELSAILAGIDTKEGVATSTKGLGNITLSGEQTLNGVLTSTSRVLVTDQTLPEENGIYVTAAGAWARAADADTDPEVTNGNIVHVLSVASTKFKFKYLLVTADPIVVGTTGQTWEEHRDSDFGTTGGTVTEGNDPRIPTQDENDALVGTDGTPATGNPYVTDSDSRNTNARTPTAHALGGAEHTPSTQAALNAKVSDADLVALAGQLGGSAASPDVRGIRETGDPALLTIGAIVDGQFAKRVGSTFVGAEVAQVREPLRNETGGEIPKGTLVAVSGFSAGRPTVVIADKDDPDARPALAVTEAAVANNTNFEGLVLGLLTGLNTSAFSVNDQLALGDGGVVLRPPPDTDPFTGEIQLVGSVVRSDVSDGSIYFTLSSGLLPMTAAQFFLVKETGPTGSVSGGDVARATGLNVDVASGSGFVNDDTDVFRVTWSAVTNLALTANATNFIFVDKNGVVTASVSPPAIGDNILLADAITDGSSILLLANHRVLLKERPALAHDYAKDVIGNVVVSGLITIKDAIAFRLQVDAGTFYVRDFKVTVPATDPITFTYWFRDGSGGFTRVAGSTLIDKDKFDDGSGTLAALVATEFKKDLLFVVFTATGLVEYHVFYGQEKFTSQSEAEAGNLPAADGDVISNGVRSGGIVIEGAAAAIASVVDVRPFVGQLASGTTAVTDHGLLSGLTDDDHGQYLLSDGTRAMSGSLDMGTNGITNVGNVDGVDVSAHKDRHKAAGADPFTATDFLEAIVKRLRTTTGPTDLLVGAWADGDVLQRVGATAVGIKPAVVNDTISVYDNVGGDEFMGADITVNLDATKLNSDGSKFSLASDEITVVDAGNYLISWQVSAEETGGDAASFRAQLRIDTGAGFGPIDGTDCFAATGKDGGEDSTASGSIAMAIGAGDKIQLRVRREGAAGTYDTIVDGSRLTIMRVT